MANHNSQVVNIDAFLSRPLPLPEHAFCIGRGGEFGVSQFPDLRAMVFFAVGKGPRSDNPYAPDYTGSGPEALGRVFGDAALKLMRGDPLDNSDPFDPYGWSDLLEDLRLNLFPLTPKAMPAWESLLFRVNAALVLALRWQDRWPAVITALDRLTNERLTERARAILETGIDPGADDLWVDVPQMAGDPYAQPI